jgi:hypothetical protein
LLIVLKAFYGHFPLSWGSPGREKGLGGVKWAVDGNITVLYLNGNNTI